MSIYTTLYLHINNVLLKLKKENITLYNYFDNNIRYPMKYLGDHLLHAKNEEILHILEGIDKAFLHFTKLYIYQEDLKHIILLHEKIRQLYMLTRSLKTEKLGEKINKLSKREFITFIKINKDDGSFYLLDYK